MSFGSEADETTSAAMFHRVREKGINFFDTADVYGWKKGQGVTEGILGDWFASGSGKSDPRAWAISRSRRASGSSCGSAA